MRKLFIPFVGALFALIFVACSRKVLKGSHRRQSHFELRIPDKPAVAIRPSSIPTITRPNLKTRPFVF
jgi:hypothetical protein